MSLLTREIEANFATFTDQWKRELALVMGELAKGQAKFSSCYKKMVCLNAWREFLSAQVSAESAQFLIEAQNDALVSYVLASMGCWRSALNSLRGCIENVGFCLYYKDHPIELQLWLAGKHRIDFQGLLQYLARHPALEKCRTAKSGLDVLRSEYSTLSRAVHGSQTFRMTGGGATTSLWSSDTRSLGRWITRQSRTMVGVNLLLLSMFRELVEGPRQPGLRAAVALAIPPTRYNSIRRDIHISLSRE